MTPVVVAWTCPNCQAGSVMTGAQALQDAVMRRIARGQIACDWCHTTLNPQMPLMRHD